MRIECVVDVLGERSVRIWLDTIACVDSCYGHDVLVPLLFCRVGASNHSIDSFLVPRSFSRGNDDRIDETQILRWPTESTTSALQLILT